MAYDMIPEALGAALDVPEWQEKHYCIQYASAYIAISHNTAQDLIKFFSTIAPQTITVAYPGVSTNIFFPATTEEIQSFRAKYDITKPYFLLTAVNKNYKNNLLFFAAFSQLQNQQDFEVICIGTDTELKPELKAYVTGTTVHLLPLSDAELRIAYSDALALVYPSLYEGFGLPVLEAMVCGCPVITCPNASLPEVGGEAVLYVNDRDVEGMANALHEVQKPSVREALVNAGLARSRHFSWSTMAAIVQSALVDATLLPLQLRAVNLIAFPDWHLPEDTLLQDLETAIRAVFTAADRGNITLLIYTGTVDSEIASFAISDVTLNLLMAEELPEETMPEISLVPTLSEMQWKALIPRIQGRIGLKNEDKAAIALAGAEAL
jgi:hypothetical protein